MTTIVFPGTFNPFTIGHASLVERALPLCDRLVIAVGYNASKHQAGDEPIEARVEAIRRVYAGEPRVSVVAYGDLTVDLCAREGARWMLRGVRSAGDFEYERNLADINRELAGVETLLLYSLPQYSHISSSMVRELMAHGRDVSKYIP